MRLGVNIDHVAPSETPVVAPIPILCAPRALRRSGADGITAHLREDRRHISDADIDGLMDVLSNPADFEMAATEEMQATPCATNRMLSCSCRKSARNVPPKAAGSCARGKQVGTFIAPLRGCWLSRVDL
ncbi:UNVERIFIED_CONTAM: hypothetical protein GTU68_017785 [Idotea baltica]|nr:hypothetical protein [Idotea baltica]